MTLRDLGEQPMREDRSIDHDRQTQIMTLANADISTAITHQVVKGSRFHHGRWVS